MGAEPTEPAKCIIRYMNTTQELSLEDKLALINKMVEEASDNPEEQLKVLESNIIDPQDALNCEGCQ